MHEDHAAPPAVTTRPVLVGECNPYGGDPYYALYPAPDGCSGHRLCRLVFGMDPDDYLEAFDRINLCAGKWSVREARESAVRLLTAGGRFVLLGAKVCDGFGVPFVPFTVQDKVLLRLPHPSGLNRRWAEPGAFDRARAAVAAFLPEVAPLLGRSPA